MPVIFLGIVEYKGTSKKTGRPYEMREIHFADLANSIKRSDLGFSQGLVSKTLPISEDAILKFKDLKPTTAINLELEGDPDRDYQTTRVSGYKLPPSPATAQVK